MKKIKFTFEKIKFTLEKIKFTLVKNVYTYYFLPNGVSSPLIWSNMLTTSNWLIDKRPSAHSLKVKLTSRCRRLRELAFETWLSMRVGNRFTELHMQSLLIESKLASSTSDSILNIALKKMKKNQLKGKVPFYDMLLRF